jgi:hypothetical protein
MKFFTLYKFSAILIVSLMLVSVLPDIVQAQTCTTPPTVTTPVNYCQNAIAAKLTASGTNVMWIIGTTYGSAGGNNTLSSPTSIYVASDVNNNRKTLFTTTANNVTITSVDYYVNSWQTTTILCLGIFDNSGTLMSSSSTITSVPSVGSNTKVTNVFNFTITAKGNYSIGIVSGTGILAFDNPSFPKTESTGTINITGVSPTGNRCFNNILFGQSSIAPTPSTTTVGTTNYKVIQTAGGCTSPTNPATIAVVVSAPPAATISYSGTPFCKSLVTAQSVTQTGTAGGVYSSTAGLTINASSGAITPNTSTAGTYTVTYTMAATGGCGAQTATTSVTITTLPAATISYSGTPFCKSLVAGQPVTQSGTVNGVYSSTTGLIINASSGAITPSTSTVGTYTVTYTMAAAGGCAAQTATTSVTITPLPSATITYNGSPFCMSLATGQSVTQTGTTGGVYTSTTGLTINASSGAITPSTSTAGTYTVTYTMAAAGGCTAQTATVSITITTLPAATITYNGSPYCMSLATGQSVTQSGTTGGVYSSTTGLTIVAGTGAITPSTSTAGTYTVTYTMAAAGGCAAQTTTASVTITTLPAATISYSGSPFCKSLVASQSVTQTGTAGGVYSSTTGLTINASSGAITPSTSTAGTYTVTYTMAAIGGCTAQTATVSITITTLPAATISYSGSPFCPNAGTASVTRTGTAGGTYSSTTGLSINSSTGDITVSASTPATYIVTYSVASSGGCSVYTTTASVQIFAINNNQIDYTNGTHGVICATPAENSTAILTAPSGNVFTTVGFASYGLPAGTCQAFTIGGCNATTSQSVTESYLLGLNTASIGANNTTFTDPCVGTVKQLYVQATYTQPICAGTTPGTISGTTPTGGNGVYTYLWEMSTTSSSIGFSAASGTNNTKDYVSGILSQNTWYRRTVLSGGCSNVSQVIQVTVNQKPTATISYSASPYCSNGGTASVTFSGTTGGTYSSTAGLTINSLTGDITLSSGTAGIYNVTYTMVNGACTNTATTPVTITALPTSANAGADQPGASLCSTVTLAGNTPVTGTGAWSIISGSGGTVTTPASPTSTFTGTAGTSYTLRWTISNSPCNVSTDDVIITFNQNTQWTGNVNTDWATAGNWCSGSVPTATTNVTISSGITNMPSIGSGDSCNNLTINAGATVVVTGAGILNIAGTISNSGTFTAGSGTIAMTGTSLQTIPASAFAGNLVQHLTINNSAGVNLNGTLNIAGILLVSAGQFNTGGFLTLLSTATQTALIDGSGLGGVLGNVTMQGYLASAFGYHYISSPFQAALVSQLLKCIKLADTTSIPSLYRYDESLLSSGWVNYTDSTGLLNQLQGYTANFGISILPKTFNLTGVVNNGIISTPTLYNHHNPYTLGFNLVGNPYPSPIDISILSGWTRTNIDNAFYFFNASTTDQYGGIYSSYVNGISTGIISTIIPAMQGFFIHVSDGTFPVSGNLSFNNNVRIRQLTPPIRALNGIDDRPLVRLCVQSVNDATLSDPMVVYFDDLAIPAYNKDLDALKLMNTDTKIPNLYAVSTDATNLSISAIPNPGNSSKKVPLGLEINTSGWLLFNASTIKNIPAGMHIYLSDTQAGINQDLQLNPLYRLYLPVGKYKNRFFLTFSKGLISTTPETDTIATTEFKIYSTGKNLMVTSTYSKATLVVINMLGQIVLKQDISGMGNHEIKLQVSSGIYLATLVSDKARLTKKIFIRN